jgi:hypothetical protein
MNTSKNGKQEMAWMPPGSRKTGRPRDRWMKRNQDATVERRVDERQWMDGVW